MARFCVNCGAELGEGMNFCIQCGTKVEEIPSKPQEERSQVIEQTNQGATQAVQQTNIPTAPVQNVAPAVNQTQNVAAAPAPNNGKMAKVVSTGAFFGLDILYAIPFVGFIASIIMCAAHRNGNVKHHAAAKIIEAVIGFVVFFLFIAVILAALDEANFTLNEFISEIISEIIK